MRQPRIAGERPILRGGLAGSPAPSIVLLRYPRGRALARDMLRRLTPPPPALARPCARSCSSSREKTKHTKKNCYSEVRGPLVSDDVLRSAVDVRGWTGLAVPARHVRRCQGLVPGGDRLRRSRSFRYEVPSPSDAEGFVENLEHTTHPFQGFFPPLCVRM